jgi:hypothetical protein
MWSFFKYIGMSVSLGIFLMIAFFGAMFFIILIKEVIM